MMLRPLSLAAALLFALVAAAPRPAAADGAAGVWQTQAGDARIQVSPCGGKLCGKVVWLKDAIDPATGKPQVDDKNRNPALRKRPIMGLQLFIDMKPTGPSSWSGRIYNADDGQAYDSTVSLAGSGKLEVKGCVGPLCGGESWTRVK
jgi:uncharacterized protein (DUF2147 family)